VTVTLPPTTVAISVTVRGPSGSPQVQRVPASDRVRLFRVCQATRCGVYRVSAGPPLAKEFAYAANLDPAESELQRVSRRELTQLLGPFQYVSEGKSVVVERLASQSTASLHRAFLYFAVALLLADSVLAWRFGRPASK